MNTGDTHSDVRDHLAVDDLPPPPPGRTGWPWTEGGDAPACAPGTAQRWPKVTVVVPSYNQGRFIEETLRSVLLQGYPELELIVMDGGSTDETVDLLRKYEPWLSFWVSEPDRGQTHAINKGLERATGEIFAYLNSDDLLVPGALFQVAEGFRSHPDADVVHGRCVYVDEGGTELFSVRGKATSFIEYLRIWKRFADRDFLTQPEVFCRTRCLKEVGGFREELRSVMDFEMWLRLLSRGHRFQAIDAPVAKFRIYAAQKSSVDPGSELCRVVQEYVHAEGVGIAPALRRSLLEELEEARAHLLVRAAIAATMLDRYGDTLRYCLSAVSAHPRIAATYAFWAALAHPLKRFLSADRRRALREHLGVGTT